MKDPKIFQQGAIFRLELLEKSHPEFRSSETAHPVSEQTLKVFHDHLEAKYGQQYHLPSRTTYSYLINGVVVDITRQGHQHYKSARLWSSTKEGLVSLLDEAKLEA
ncbi:MAG: hypothetical protein Q7R87_01295 [Nanoarchaeota archaeon]|nr:hypothetical protein [Nanoarchaeota archaeon]